MILYMCKEKEQQPESEVDMKECLKEWNVYGADGHRQRESFADSFSFNTMNGAFIMIRNYDMTGTHEYTKVIVLAKNEKLCDEEFETQLTDGVFENSRTGKIEVTKIQKLFN